jgi:hypothetical protein
VLIAVDTPASFVAARRPDSELYQQLSRLDPANPFVTLAHARAEQETGGEPWLLGWRDGGAITGGCLGFVRRGRLNRQLSITSLPEMPPDFWAGLKGFITAQGITLLELNTFCSRAANIPPLGTELKRRLRFEYVVPLEGTPADLLRRMHQHHRQSVRKGMNAGLVVRADSESRPDEHVKLIGASLQRRTGRGEQIESPPTMDGILACVNSGLCRLFQACRGDEVLSSMTVAIARRGRYLHTSGTSAEGMKIGASHYLLYEIMRVSLVEGATLFNLGGVSDPHSGLAMYKRHFGCDRWKSESAEFYVGSGLRRVAWRAAQLMQARRRTTGSATQG